MLPRSELRCHLPMTPVTYPACLKTRGSVNASVGITTAPSLLFIDREGNFPLGMGLDGDGEVWQKPGDEDREAAAQQYAGMAERALDLGELAHARLGYHMASTVRWEQGRWGAAREQTLRAERVVRGGDEESRIVGVAEAAKCLVMIERDLGEADAMLMEASALARRRGFNHPAIAAGLGMLRFHENRLDEADDAHR